jgi:hypothetical protein
MVRRPDPTHTLVQAGNRLLEAPEFLAAGVLQQIRFQQDLFLLQVPYAYNLLATIDIVALDNGMSVRTRRDTDFDLRMGFGKSGEAMLEERTNSIN